LDALSAGQIEVASMTLQAWNAYQHALKHLDGTGVSPEGFWDC